jgi:hypothetical protein
LNPQLLDAAEQGCDASRDWVVAADAARGTAPDTHASAYDRHSALAKRAAWEHFRYFEDVKWSSRSRTKPIGAASRKCVLVCIR